MWKMPSENVTGKVLLTVCDKPPTFFIAGFTALTFN